MRSKGFVIEAKTIKRKDGKVRNIPRLEETYWYADEGRKVAWVVDREGSELCVYINSEIIDRNFSERDYRVRAKEKYKNDVQEIYRMYEGDGVVFSEFSDI